MDGLSGGIIGGTLANEVNIKICSNNGTITSDSNKASGICAGSINSISDCYNIGSIKGGNNTTGIVDSANMISNCYNTGNIDGGCSAGIVYQTSGKVINCYNTGNVIGTVWNVSVGGICGKFSGEMINCYNTGEVFSDNTWNYAGGLVGVSTGGEMTNCYNSGIVKIRTSQWGTIGGLVGSGDGKIIANNCYYLESITQEGIVGATEDKSQAVSSEYMQSEGFVRKLNEYIDDNPIDVENVVLIRWKYKENSTPVFLDN